LSLHASATSVALLLPVLVCSCDFLRSPKEAADAKTAPGGATSVDEGELAIPLELTRITERGAA
jgi:hypothetical protein